MYFTLRLAWAVKECGLAVGRELTEIVERTR